MSSCKIFEITKIYSKSDIINSLFRRSALEDWHSQMVLCFKIVKTEAIRLLHPDTRFSEFFRTKMNEEKKAPKTNQMNKAEFKRHQMKTKDIMSLLTTHVRHKTSSEILTNPFGPFGRGWPKTKTPDDPVPSIEVPNFILLHINGPKWPMLFQTCSMRQ